MGKSGKRRGGAGGRGWRKGTYCCRPVVVVHIINAALIEIERRRKEKEVE